MVDWKWIVVLWTLRTSSIRKEPCIICIVLFSQLLFWTIHWNYLRTSFPALFIDFHRVCYKMYSANKCIVIVWTTLYICKRVLIFAFFLTKKMLDIPRKVSEVCYKINCGVTSTINKMIVIHCQGNNIHSLRGINHSIPHQLWRFYF